MTRNTQLALRLRDEAIASVEANTSDEWAEAAWSVVLCLTDQFPIGGFTSDDLWEQLELRGVKAPHIKDALGAVMLRARKERIIQCIGWKASARPESHGQPKRVWRKVFNGG